MKKIIFKFLFLLFSGGFVNQLKTKYYFLSTLYLSVLSADNLYKQICLV